VDRVLRAISAALGLPYELVAKDFSKTNYSSARAALLEARRFFRCRQEWIARKLCQPSWNMLMEEAFLMGEWDVPNFYENILDWCRVKWIAPGWQWVDPVKEVESSLNAIKGHLSTLADECASQGRDWEEVLEEEAREQKKKDELGIKDEQQKPAPIQKDQPVDPNGEPIDEEPAAVPRK
jgi:lambda family phage portal protein